MLRRVVFVAVGRALVAAAGIVIYSNLGRSDQCDVCYRPCTRKRITESTAPTERCWTSPRCGLRFQEGRNDVVSTEVTDFNIKELVAADEARIGSRCDRLTFSSPSAA